jgi:hypothetical protein
MKFTDEQKEAINAIVERRLVADRRRRDREVQTLTDERDRLRADVDRLAGEAVTLRDELARLRDDEQRGVVGRVRQWLTGNEA